MPPTEIHRGRRSCLVTAFDTRLPLVIRLGIRHCNPVIVPAIDHVVMLAIIEFGANLFFSFVGSVGGDEAFAKSGLNVGNAVTGHGIEEEKNKEPGFGRPGAAHGLVIRWQKRRDGSAFAIFNEPEWLGASFGGEYL